MRKNRQEAGVDGRLEGNETTMEVRPKVNERRKEGWVKATWTTM